MKTDLWMVGNIALTLLHFFYEVNEGRNVIKFADEFWGKIQELGQRNEALRQEMLSTDRVRRVIKKEASREG